MAIFVPGHVFNSGHIFLTSIEQDFIMNEVDQSHDEVAETDVELSPA
jgi:hypothetical protein